MNKFCIENICIIIVVMLFNMPLNVMGAHIRDLNATYERINDSYFVTVNGGVYSDENGLIPSDANTITLLMLKENSDGILVKNDKTYDWLFVDQIENSTPTSAINYTFSTPVDLNNGNYFIWAGADNVDMPFSYNFLNNSITYTVTFNSNEGTVINSIATSTGEISLPTPPTRTGFSFDGWYTDNTFSNVFTGTGITSDIIVYAKWVEVIQNTYTVTFNSNEGTVINSISTSTGEIILPTPPTRVGFSFDGWYKDSTFSNIFAGTGITSDITVYAKWVEDIQNTYTVTFNSNEGTVINSISTSTGEISLPSPPTKTGFSFDGWYTDNNTFSSVFTGTGITSNITVYAKWVVSNDNGGNSGNVDTSKIDFVDQTTSDNTGNYQFDIILNKGSIENIVVLVGGEEMSMPIGWKNNSDNNENITVISGNSDMNVTVKGKVSANKMITILLNIDNIIFKNVTDFNSFNIIVTNEDYKKPTGIYSVIDELIFNGYGNLTIEEKQAVFNFINNNPNINWHNTGLVKSVLNEIVALKVINKSNASVQTIKEHLKYLVPNGNNNDNICEYILNNKSTNITKADFILLYNQSLDIFVQNEMLKEFKADTIKSQVLEFITKNIIIFNSEYVAKYNNNSYVGIKNYVAEKLLTYKSSISNLNELATKFNFYIDEYINIQANQSNVNSNGSNGGSQIITNSSKDVIVPILPTAIFKDIEDFGWAKEAIAILSKSGIINGYGDNEFRPNEKITREQFIKMLVLAFDMQEANATSDFNDVDSSKWYFPFVSSAFNKGITNGIGDGKFGIGEYIIREEMATMAYRTSKIAGKLLPDINQPKAFNDSTDISDYAKESISKMQQSGIINGIGDGNFEPKNTATRAEAAVMVYGLYKGSVKY